jgi:hypothetical protein
MLLDHRYRTARHCPKCRHVTARRIILVQGKRFLVRHNLGIAERHVEGRRAA